MQAKQAGFTLIELVVVIVILGILAATALPKLQSLDSSAKTAVLQASQAALNSAAVITYGSVKAASTFSTIKGQTTLDSKVNSSGNCGGSGGGTITLTYNSPAEATQSFTLPAELCVN
ncbi:MAG TPA: type II secretion system protein [Novimethylophilus sp.]|jgi:MSHA pilin protein MshA|uniref:type II secretion system protein n=1 Tax=Novimethylophilus sp. TaxID=2137426 RepID=UPI002F4179CD